jgi:hypothetical protein
MEVHLIRLAFHTYKGMDGCVGRQAEKYECKQHGACQDGLSPRMMGTRLCICCACTTTFACCAGTCTWDVRPEIFTKGSFAFEQISNWCEGPIHQAELERLS